ncbi:YaaC family protein [Calidifontibacillus oryziterrae]|uniref:YaaC family protein n=1 Tax=Calidifontibacillus oryziterrae TaxID=1191699 RepID=UPI0002D34DED|nr:YaaC family protein [Calidifontibacillus oryziterrae]
MNSIWQSFSIFHSSIYVQKYLLHRYNKIGLIDPEKKSYNNCYPFIYYLNHAKSYYKLAVQSPISIQPILMFYGMIQLLKACLLTVDPEYPDSSIVLAHGVTTRKRKKKNYDFLNDEVKIQKNGLFPHFAEKIFKIKQLEAEKYTMERLLTRIPELNDLFKKSFEKIQSYKIGMVNNEYLYIPICILDDLNMTHSRFIDFLKQVFPFKHQLHTSIETNHNDFIKILINKKININECSPLQYHFFEQTLYIPINREQFSIFPEIMTHYLLLYNLSMISRYETEWWGELLHSYDSLDYPFICNFLTISLNKVPYLIYEYLNQNF